MDYYLNSVKVLLCSSVLFQTLLAQSIGGGGVSNGCSLNGGSITVPVNTTVADEKWWYLCNGNAWLAKGCVVNGVRHHIGEQFYGYLNEFYGRCEAIDGKYVRATVLGCIDVNNQTVLPGHAYIADPLFWANCTSTNQVVSTSDLGNVTLDIIGRRIIGCNDGTEDIIPDDSTFVQVSHEGPLLAGIGLICKIRGPFPQVQPQVCVVANNSETDEAYIGLSDHCYGRVRRFVFYCTIAGGEDPINGSAIYGWEIGWNVSSKEFVTFLKTSGFRDCINEPSKKPRAETILVNFSRKRRNAEQVPTALTEFHGQISGARFRHIQMSLTASSRVVSSHAFLP